MVEESSNPQFPVSMAEETTPPASNEQSESSNKATIQTDAPEYSESSIKNAESAAVSSDSDRENSLEFADELTEKAAKAMKDRDYGEATECYSRALEIRALHFGELAPECVPAYYKYGCALLYKAQEEADPIASMPRKNQEPQVESNKDEPVKSVVNGESSVSNDAEQEMSSNQEQEADDDAQGEKNEDEDVASDAEDLAEGDEDESDLDLAWKMLDLARAISEKRSGDTIEKVDILSALAEVALEREDTESALSDYLKALSILERLVEPDNRYIAELNFRICLSLEIASKAEQAIPYCQKAISVCKSRIERLTNEVKSSSGSEPVSDASESSVSVDCVKNKQEEIETLSDLSVELEKKLEDLQQLASNPRSILSDILGMVEAKARSGGSHEPSSAAGSSSKIDVVNANGNFDSPTVSTACTNGTSGVTHLGVVGRGVKRVAPTSVSTESNPEKKLEVDSRAGSSS